MMKFDLIALSKKKAYKATMLACLGVGVLTMIIGLIMLMGVTPTVTPNKLTVDMSGLIKTGNFYQTKISQNETMIQIDTGTKDQVLTDPIVFSLDESGKKILEEIAPMYRCGLTTLKLKSAAPQKSKGTLTIKCGSQPAVKIEITTYFDNI
jgi:hypothetical protein